MIIDSIINLPITYREREIHALRDKISSGDCCQLVGASGSGKSNVLMHILREDVQQFYFGEKSKTLLFIMIDAQRLQLLGGVPGDWSVYELIINKIIEAAGLFGCDQTLLSHFESLYVRLLESQNIMLGLRYLERIVDSLCRREALRLVFLFDEFDSVLNIASVNLFNNLKGLRDTNKYRVVYIISLRDMLQRSYPQPDKIENFVELFSQNVLGIGRYDSESALAMLRRLMERKNIRVPQAIQEIILECAGNYPALILAAFSAVIEAYPQKRNVPASKIVEIIENSPFVLSENEKIWKSFKTDEQLVLAALARGTDPGLLDRSILSLLEAKGFWVASEMDKNFGIFSKLFLNFLRTGQTLKDTMLLINPTTGEVMIDGYPRSVTGLPYKLLLMLASNPGKVFTRDELISRIYDHQVDDPNAEYNYNLIDNLVRRLRKCIEMTPGNPQILLTVRRQGYRLAADKVKLLESGSLPKGVELVSGEQRR